MKNRSSRFLLALSVLMVASLACSALSILGSGALLEDDFAGSDSNWGTGSDADSSVEYLNETLNFFVIKDYYFVWSTPNDETYENVHIEVTALNSSQDPGAAFGVICNMQVTDTSYYFAITGAGTYAIGLSTLVDDVLLTNDGEWAESDVIPVGAASYRIGADCASNGTLSLYVDGNLVDTVVDTTYTSGTVALFGWSDDETSATNVSFDDFIVTELE